LDASLQDSLEYMVMTRQNRVRWDRLEGLLQSASSAEDWELLPATNLFVDFLFKPENAHLRYNLARPLPPPLPQIATPPPPHPEFAAAHARAQMPGARRAAHQKRVTSRYW
jgi:hypothetical protein